LSLPALGAQYFQRLAGRALRALMRKMAPARELVLARENLVIILG
jgi:hypothetical protein